MSYMNYAGFEEALQKSAKAAAPAPSRWRLPRWLVDSEFDARMERERNFLDATDERLPLRARAGKTRPMPPSCRAIRHCL